MSVLFEWRLLVCPMGFCRTMNDCMIIDVLLTVNVLLEFGLLRT